MKAPAGSGEKTRTSCSGAYRANPNLNPKVLAGRADRVKRGGRRTDAGG